MERFQYTKENIRRMQLVELGILAEFDRICRNNSISYIIDAGTLLGAVRHGGFIPWDDDIDIRMLRSDYDRFCEICKNELNKDYFLQTYKTDSGYRWGYSRILKNGTVFIRENHEEIKSRNGIFIDIFPNDNMPTDRVRHGYCTLVSLLCRKMLYSQIGRKHAKNIVYRAGYAFLDLFPKKWAHRLLEHLTQKYKNIKTNKVRCFGWGSREETRGFEKEWLEDTRDIIFENIIVKAPVKANEFLIFSFGTDYMTPPPENKQKPKHIATYVRFE